MPTPPSRRRPSGPPTRRPRVAGLRKPGRPDPAASVEEPRPTTWDDTTATGEALRTPDEAPSRRAPEDTPDEDLLGREGAIWTGDRLDRDTPPDLDQDEPFRDAPDQDVLVRDASDQDDLVRGDLDRDDLDRDASNQDVLDREEDDQEERDREERDSDQGEPERDARGGARAVPAGDRAAGGHAKAASAATRARGLNLAIALAVLALVCAALGFWFKGQADRLTDGADSSNLAFVDPAATSEVKSKMTVAVERALSYDFADMEATAGAVRELLTGRAVCEYDQLFGQLRELAPAQKMVLTTKVRELGVRSLGQDQAELLVFVDQTATRTDQNQTTASGAQFGVSAAKVDGAWKIAAFDMFDQPLPGGRTAPSC